MGSGLFGIYLWKKKGGKAYMQYSTFAAIDIGSYDVILEIFEISKKQGDPERG